jgi:hypothetical protein
MSKDGEEISRRMIHHMKQNKKAMEDLGITSKHFNINNLLDQLSH